MRRPQMDFLPREITWAHTVWALGAMGSSSSEPVAGAALCPGGESPDHPAAASLQGVSHRWWVRTGAQNQLSSSVSVLLSSIQKH